MDDSEAVVGVRRSKPKRVRLAPEARRAQLLDAAAALINREGSAACSMERVAREAKASTSLVYVYFADRTELLTALLEREFAYLMTEAPRIVEAASSLPDRIIDGFRFYLDAMEERGPIFHLLVGEPSIDLEIERRRSSGVDNRTRYWRDIVVADLQIDETAALLLADQFLAAGGSLVRRWLRGEVTRQNIEDAFTGYLLNGLGDQVRKVRAGR